VLIVLIIASLVTKYIDTANVSTGHEPECCIKIVSADGGKVTYWGLGYKVVRYVGVSPEEPYEDNIGVKMGSWFMKYEDTTNVILDVKSFGGNQTFKVSNKADVDFITNLLKNSKYIDEPCDGIIDYAITYDDYTYDVLISCSEIRKGNKQAKISDKDMEELAQFFFRLNPVYTSLPSLLQRLVNLGKELLFRHQRQVCLFGSQLLHVLQHLRHHRLVVGNLAHCTEQFRVHL
jgi:hypothetical protein